MSIEDKVLGKLNQKVEKELEKALNKEESIEGYTRRTMHGKLAKKLAIKQIKKETGSKPTEEVTDSDLHNKVVGGLVGSKNHKKLEKAHNLMFISGILVFVLGVLAIILNNFPLLVVFTLLGVILGLTLTLTGLKLNKGEKIERTPEEKELLHYNRVLEYKDNGKYYRNYELLGLPTLQKYKDENKLKPIKFNELEGKEVAPTLTSLEIQKFKEANKLEQPKSNEEKEVENVGETKVEEVEVEETKVEEVENVEDDSKVTEVDTKEVVEYEERDSETKE